MASAVSIITKTIKSLEQINAEYHKTNEEIDVEICKLTTTHLDNHNKIKENEKVIENFKNLLN